MPGDTTFSAFQVLWMKTSLGGDNVSAAAGKLWHTSLKGFTGFPCLQHSCQPDCHTCRGLFVFQRFHSIPIVRSFIFIPDSIRATWCS